MILWDRHKSGARWRRILTSWFLIICLLVVHEVAKFDQASADGEETEEGVEYVSDVRLFYALDSMSDAISKCEESGYTPVHSDLNAGTGKNYVVMGYKTTRKKSEAVCSIKLLSMDSGYELTDYSELQEQYESSNAAVIDAIEAAALEFAANYAAGSPKAKEAYEGLNLIEVPEEDNIKLGDYIVSGEADWDFYAKVVTRASAGTTSAIIGFLATGTTAYRNEYDSKTKNRVSISWAESVAESPVWEELEEAVTEDDYDELYMEYGDDAKGFHKELQKFATGYENAMAVFDESEYQEEMESCEGMSDEEMLDSEKEMSDNEQSVMYLAIFEQLNRYDANEDYALGDYLLELGHENSESVDLTKLYPVIDSMTYAQRCLARLGGLMAVVSTTEENVENKEAEEKISEAAKNIKELVGRDSYSVWMNNNEEIKGKKVAYTSDAVRMNAAQKLVEDYETTSWEDKANEVMKWVNMALGIISCVLVLAKFSAVAYVLALIPTALCAIAAACGLTCAATTLSAVAGAIQGFASAAVGPVGWITLAVLVISMLVIWAVTEIIKYIKENRDIDYEDAPDFAADRVKGPHGEYLVYYKGVGSEWKQSGKYKSKRTEAFDNNYHGEEGISDVNGRMGFRGWNCMFYSKDENTGSPIVVKDGENPFRVTHGEDSAINGYDNVKAFGEITPGNCNSLMKKDDVGGIYIHYRTLESIKNESGAETSEGVSNTGNTGKKLYYKDIIVRSSDTEARAKAKIKTKGYMVWDHNLANNARKDYSRYEEWAYTYLGFKTTTDPAEAIKDIRVATFTPQSTKSLSFGEITYGCAGNLGYKADNKTEDKEYPADLDGLWITSDANAGTAIEVGKLHLVADHANGDYVNKGWVPVTTFSGVPYNFASTRDSDTDDWQPGRLGNYGYRYTCYQTRSSNEWKCPARYLYYEPQVLYTSGTKYLSALFFVFGTDSESTAAKVGETEAKVSQLVDRMRETPNTEVDDDTNLAKSFYYKGYVVESNQKYLYMGYSWSYNPYRALTDIKAFQGTIFSSELPYSISKAAAYSGNQASKNIAYDAATVITQRTTTRCVWAVRGIGPENAYMAPNGLLGTNKQIRAGYTSYQPGGYVYNHKKMPFIATGLYVSGPVQGAEKLTLNDIVISAQKHKATNNDGKITVDISNEETLAGEEASGEFNSIQEIKQPYALEPFNIAYPEWTDDDGNHHDAGTPYYIYIRKPALKKRYISKIFVGSFDVAKAKPEEEDDDMYQEIMKQVDLNAMVEANGAATDEVLPANVAVEQGRTWYGTDWGEYVKTDKFQGLKYFDKSGGWYDADDTPGTPSKDDRLPWAPPKREVTEDGSHSYGGHSTEYINRPASYLSVARTDNPDEAIKGILLFKSAADVVPEKIQVGGVEYICASCSTPILMSQYAEGYENKTDEHKWKSVKYYVYYTTNKGVAPGLPITELTVDKEVFNSGQTTALCVNKKDTVETSKDGRKTIKEKAKPYGEASLPVYIHASYEKDANMFFNKIFTANGSTKRKAQLKLLELGCTEFCDMNLNEGTSLGENETKKDNKGGGEYVYFGYRGYTLNEKLINSQPTKETKDKEREEELKEAVYDIVCTVGEKFHPEGIQTDRYQIYYTPVIKTNDKDEIEGIDLNAGTNGAPIYMYYTTTWAVEQYNAGVGKDVRKNLSPMPKDYLKSPLTRICFTRYDLVPYSIDGGSADWAASSGDDSRPWEYVMDSDYAAPVDFNDGAVKLDRDLHTENNRISMFAQRADGSVKGAAEITGGYMSTKAQIGEMWHNR